MLGRLWRWLKNSFRRWFGTPEQGKRELNQSEDLIKVPQLPDAEYESVFLELLAGVNQGWSRGRVQGFLDGKNIERADLVQWLRGFGERLLASDAENEELAERMVHLGELNVGEVGEVARGLGLELWARGENRTEAESAEEEGGDAEEFFNQALEFSNAGKFEEALVSYENVIAIQPDDYQAWNNRGVALLNLGRFSEAITSYDKAIEIQPNIYQAWINRGNALTNLEQFSEALISHNKAIEIQPNF